MTPEGVQVLSSSADEIEKLLVRYRKHLLDAGILARDADSRYCSFFDAGLILAKLAVRAHGLRASGSHMNHYTQIRLAQSILGRQAHAHLSILENARTKRNHATYDEAGTISATETAELERTILAFETIVRDWLAREHPDLMPPELPLG